MQVKSVKVNMFIILFWISNILALLQAPFSWMSPLYPVTCSNNIISDHVSLKTGTEIVWEKSYRVILIPYRNVKTQMKEVGRN